MRTKLTNLQTVIQQVSVAIKLPSNIVILDMHMASWVEPNLTTTRTAWKFKHRMSALSGRSSSHCIIKCQLYRAALLPTVSSNVSFIGPLFFPLYHQMSALSGRSSSHCIFKCQLYRAALLPTVSSNVSFIGPLFFPLYHQMSALSGRSSSHCIFKCQLYRAALLPTVSSNVSFIGPLFLPLYHQMRQRWIDKTQRKKAMFKFYEGFLSLKRSYL